MTILYIGIGILIGYISQLLLRKIPVKKKQISSRKNLGFFDRGVRFLIGVFFLFWGFSAGVPVLFVASGFSFFEAFSSWCVFFSLTGKNSCKI